MNKKTFQMTLEGKELLEKELEELLTVKRQEVIERLQAAREFGDLSENSEYDAARDEQAAIEANIQKIENMLKNAEIIEIHVTDIVQFGSTVTFENVDTKEEATYQIVGTVESDPLHGKISVDSPVALALEGKQKGMIVSVALPNGKTMNVKIIDVK